jgi:hypothetical protein
MCHAYPEGSTLHLALREQKLETVFQHAWQGSTPTLWVAVMTDAHGWLGKDSDSCRCNMLQPEPLHSKHNMQYTLICTAQKLVNMANKCWAQRVAPLLPFSFVL